jgi:RHS repeat-associated protein
MALWVAGQLRNADGEPLPRLNVVALADPGAEPLGHGTSDEDGAFAVELDLAPAEPPERLRFEVLSGALEMLHRTPVVEIGFEPPDRIADVVLRVPLGTSPADSPRGRSTDAEVAAIRVVPAEASIALGDRVVLAAEPRDGEGRPMIGVLVAWHAVGPDGAEAPVSPAGELTGRTSGTYEVVASAGGREGSARITVLDHVPAPLSTEPPVPLAPAAAELARLADDGDADDGPRWNDVNAVSAFDPGHRVGPPPAPFLAAMVDRPWLGSRRDALSEAVTAGSANFTVTATVLHLPGRGIDLRLDLIYNSRLWQRTGAAVDFDVDKGWPAPGWSLGFGRIVRTGGQGSMVVDADGTRHPFETLRLRNGPGGRTEFAGRTTDGSFIDYEHVDDWSGGFQWAQARHPDGTVVEYTARGHEINLGTGKLLPSWGVMFPTRITSASGNVVTITYRGNAGPEIDTIVDTLGRTITFHYAAAGELTGITAPGVGGGRRTVVRFNLGRIRLAYAFAGLVTPRTYQLARVVRAIYYPGSATGYWFGDSGTYSGYGMATRVERQRGMGFAEAPLTEPGTITAGTLTHRRSYDYPLVADPGLADVPSYRTMTEVWERMDGPPAVTRFAVQTEADPRRLEVTYPNGTRTVTLAHNHPGRFDDGLPFRQEVYEGDELLELTTSQWQQGDYRSPRLSRVETTHRRSLMTAVEYDYGPFDRLTEMREYDFGGAALLRRTRTDYDTRQGYLQRHILRLPTVVETFEGSSASPAARTEYAYDARPLRDAPGLVQHALSHNPYAPRTWVPPYDETECDDGRRPPCRTIHHDGFWQTEYDERTRFRGNLTEVRRYADPVGRGAPVVERRTYDIAGNLVLSETDRFDRSAWEYGPQTQYAYPTRHVTGPAQPASAQVAVSAAYDVGTGLVEAQTDANGRTARLSHDVRTLRPTLVIWPSNAGTEISYDDAELTVTELNTRAIDGTLTALRVTTYNGLGLPHRVAALAGMPDPANPEPLPEDVVDIQYDALGRPWRRTRPYRAGEAPQWTEVHLDALGRFTLARGPDGSETAAHYDERQRPDSVPEAGAGGRATRLVDAWGRERWTLHGALGQLQAEVDPDPDGDGSVFRPGTTATFYARDALDRVVHVLQGGQIRRFRYDGLGRLTHQAVPERDGTLDDAGQYHGPGARWSDVITYTEGNRIAAQVDPRGVRTVHHYDDDPLGRLRRVEYQQPIVPLAFPLPLPDPPRPASGITYEYATTGDLTRVARVSTAHLVGDYRYDTEGRLASETFTAPDRPGEPLEIGYGYDDFGRLTRLTYPAAYGAAGAPRRRVELAYDLAGRPQRLTVDGVARAADVSYAADGQPVSLTLGPGDPLPVWETYRLDPGTGLLLGQLVSRDGVDLIDLAYGYTRGGLSGVTGQLTSVVDNLDPFRCVTYAYDAAGRLREAHQTRVDPAWSQRYGYDRYGNRTEVAAAGVTAGGDAMPPDGVPLGFGGIRSRNRIVSPGYEYDEAGNLTRSPQDDGSWQRYAYDAAGRLVAVTDDEGAPLETYVYGACRRRILTLDETTGALTVHAWRDDDLLAEYDAAGATLSWSRALVHLGRRLLCSFTPRDGAEVVRYHHPDRLGTRLVTSPGEPDASSAPLPYGTLPGPDGSPPGSPAFTSYERSPVTGLDYAVNRHYNRRLGRFLQPDPLGPAAMQPGEPASNNLYAYVAGDPVNAVDPSGLLCFDRLRGYVVGPTVVVTPDGTYTEGENTSYLYLETVCVPSADADANAREYQRYARRELEADRARGDSRAYDRLIRPYAESGPRPTTALDKIAIGMLAAPVVAVGGAIVVEAVAGLWSVPAYLYHFTSSAGAAGINSTGVINAGGGLYGAGVYLTRFTSPILATLQGARSTVAVVRVSTAGLGIVPTIFPGTFRTAGTPIVLALQELALSQGLTGTAQALAPLLP